MTVRFYSIHIVTLSDLYPGVASPSTYFAHTRNPPSSAHSSNLSSTRRLGQSSSQPVLRSSDVDFDSVPSPRRSQQSRIPRQSNGAGPSTLSKSVVASDDDEQDEIMDGGGGGGGGYDDYDAPGNEASPDAHAISQRTPRRTSFSTMNQDDDEEEADTMTPRQLPSSVTRKSNHNTSDSRDLNGTGKGKGKAHAPFSPSPPVPASDDLPHYQDQDPDQGGVEDDIAQGLDEVELGPGEESEDEEPPAKKAKVVKKPKPRKVVQLPEHGTFTLFPLHHLLHFFDI